MGFETILLEKRDHIARVTLNRPERLNAINERMFEELNAALGDVAVDTTVRVLVLTGAGRAFCASADVKEERQGGDRLLSQRSPYETREFIRSRPQGVTLHLHQMEKPTIAMVNGLAIGDGFDWVLACDIRIGCEHARFMNAFLQMGLVSNTGATWLYPRAMGSNRALELLYTGDWLEAEEAYRLGVLNRLVPAARLEEETMGLARRIAERPPIPNRLVRGMVHRGLTQSLEEHLVEAAQVEVLTLTTQDHREALAAFLEKRKPVFKGE
ncbi:MAG: enoyl-CoA hydratase/isomerase family protein [Chloroflexi bacterium]|nr:enoyl-CoA hydratase/isomerase family protein [Chloroflexota bacterium]